MKRKKIFAWLLLVVLLAGALVGLWRRPDVSGPPSMFTDLPAGEAPSSFPEQSIAKRHRWVRLDAPGMHQLALNTGEQKRVILNLFPDLEVEALVMANKTHGNGDQSALGLVNDSQDSLMVMSFHKGVMMGMVVLPDGRQVLISHVKDDKYAITEVDPSKVGGCGNCVELSGDTATATGQRKAQAPTGKDKTSAVDNGVWARRMAMADPRVLKETAAECRVYQSGKSPAARMRPLLAAMGAPMPMLAAGNKYGLHGSGGTVRQSMGPTSAHSIHYQRPGNVEYIDVLFIYDNDLLTQEGGAANGLTNIQAKTTRMIDSLNVIYTACAIPLDVRQAGNLVAGRYRSMGGNPAELTASFYTGPAWEVVQAPVRPNTTAADPKTWTVFNTTGAQPQAKVGVYQPKYENLSDRATKTFGDYLGWISDRANNSLLYGDQYWGTAAFVGTANTQEPYINLPEGTLWRLEPQDIRNSAKITYSTKQNPNLNTGPVDHPESPKKIQAEPGMVDISHDVVFRYDQGGVADVFGADYNGTYSGVLGLRMDLNNMDYGGNLFTGDAFGGGGSRYPVMHGEKGDFNATFNINIDPTKMDARADVVCILAADSLTPAGVAGLAGKYSNLKLVAQPARTVGRGPTPLPNSVQQSPYLTHAGRLIFNVSTPYTANFSGANLTPTGTVNNSPASGLAALYSFAGNTNDGSPNSNVGAMQGDATYGTDRLSAATQALALDGTGDSLSVGDNPSISGLPKISLGAWVKWTATAGTQTILSKGAAPGEFLIQAIGGTQLRVKLTDGTNTATVTATQAFTAGKWYHVFATYNGVNQTGITLYVNGFAVASSISSTVAGTLANTGDALLIGSSVNGLVDEARIYNVDLSAAQVENLYIVERPASTFNTTQGLAAHYTFTDASLADASTQGNTAALTGAPVAVIDRYSSAGNNDAFRLRAGNTINTQTSNGFPSLTGDFTLSLWLNKDAATFGGENQVIVANQAQNQFELRVRNSNGRLRFFTGINPGTPDHETTTNLTWAPGTWYQVVVTRTGNTITFYRNGVKVGNSGVTTDGNAASPTQLFLTFGDSPSAPAPLQAFIDDVRLYSRAISDSDVNDLFLLEKPAQAVQVFDQTTGLVAHYPVSSLTDTLFEVTDSVSGKKDSVVLASFSDGRVGASDGNGSYQFDGVTSHLNLGRMQLTLGAGAINTFTEVVTLANHNLQSGQIVRFASTPPTATPTLTITTNYFVRALTTGTFSLHTSFAGATGVNPTTARVNFTVAGAASYTLERVMGGGGTGGGAFSASFWANPSAMPGTSADLLGNRETSNADSWWVSVNNAGTLSFTATSGGTTTTANSAAGAISGLSAWKQVAITRDTAGQVLFYINGVVSGTGTTVNLDINGTGENLWVGRGGAGGAGAFNGKIDEVRIYHGRKLESWEVGALFATENISTGGSASIKVNFGTDDSSTGDTVRLELFNNNLTEPPFHNLDYNSSGSSITHSFVAAATGNAWQDKQGAWRITSLSGSVQVESVEITVNGITFIHKGTLTPTFTLAPNEFEQNLQMNRDRFVGMVSKLTASTSNYTFAHELGHALGLHHGIGDSGLRDDDPGITFNPYGTESTGGATVEGVGNFIRDEFLSMGNHFMAFGTPAGQPNTGTWGNYCTIMAYTAIPQILSTSGTVSVYTRIPRFSSPTVLWKSRPTGYNHGRMLPPPQGNYNRPMYFNQAQVIRLTGRVASFYRDDNGSGRLPAEWAVPVRMPRGIPDAGGITGQKPSANTTVAKANNPGGGNQGVGGGSPDGPGTGGSRRPPSPGSLPSNPKSGRANPVTSGSVVLNQGARPGGGIGGAVTTTTKPSNPPSTVKPATNPGGPTKTNPAPPRPGGVVVRPPLKGGGNPGTAVPNDSRARSQPMALRVLADRSFQANANGHNRGATGGEDAALRTDDARDAFHGRSVWWHMAVPTDGAFELQADTHGSAIDTTLSVWLPGAARPLANDNDPRRPGPASAVRVRRITLRKGQKIILAIDGVNGAQGPVKLNVRLKPVR